MQNQNRREGYVSPTASKPTVEGPDRRLPIKANAPFELFFADMWDFHEAMTLAQVGDPTGDPERDDDIEQAMTDEWLPALGEVRQIPGANGCGPNGEMDAVWAGVLKKKGVPIQLGNTFLPERFRWYRGETKAKKSNHGDTYYTLMGVGMEFTRGGRGVRMRPDHVWQRAFKRAIRDHVVGDMPAHALDFHEAKFADQDTRDRVLVEHGTMTPESAAARKEKRDEFFARMQAAFDRQFEGHETVTVQPSVSKRRAGEVEASETPAPVPTEPGTLKSRRKPRPKQ